MKKYYIPLSSLNYNNIILSESISPASYYKVRDFGIKKFFPIIDSTYNNVIILSDKLLSFSRPKSDVEDHPMVIEVSIDENKLQPICDGFYTARETIYITPYTSRFLFFTEQDRLVTESLSDHSLQVKLSDLYIPRMHVVHPTGEYDFSKIRFSESNASTDSVAEDERINRLKGMLYGYYVGAMLSTNKVEVDRLSILQEVQNEFSATLSCGEKYLSSAKENVLRELSIRWSHLNPLYIELSNAKYDVQQLNSILTKYGIRLPINNLGVRSYLPYLTNPSSEEEINPAMGWIEHEIEKQRNVIRKCGIKLSPEDSKIVTDGSNVVNIDVDDHPDLVRHWLNTLMLDYTRTPLGEYSKMELADMITDSAIEFLGDRWKESSERKFLNKLRKHIAGEAFDVEWNNGALSSVAAVVLRGDEWDTLLTFMQRKGMFDYKLAFAMYGALTGYANMTRDFTDILYEDRTYGQSVYKEFYGQLFGKDLQIDACDIPYNNPTSTKPIIEMKMGSIESNSIIEDIVQKIITSEKYDKKKHERYIRQIQTEQIDDWIRIRCLSGANRDGWKGIIDDIIKPAKKKERIYQGTINFATDNSKAQFKYDKNAWRKIIDLIPDNGWQNSKGKSRRQLIVEDLQWFQGSDMSIGNNRKDIERFCDQFKTRLDKNGKPQGQYYSPEIRKAIKERLLSLYCNNE